jgi:hypothetical protein
MVRGTWFGALLEVEEHALCGSFLIQVLERGSEPLHELCPRSKGNGAGFLVHMRREPFLGRSMEKSAGVGDFVTKAKM